MSKFVWFLAGTIIVALADAAYQGAVDLHKLKLWPTLSIWFGVFLFYVAYLYVRAQLDIHREDQHKIRELLRTIEELRSSASPEAKQK